MDTLGYSLVSLLRGSLLECVSYLVLCREVVLFLKVLIPCPL